ncbi:MAG: adenylate and Guanylate cyclase catalytic domain protein [Chthoniobacteraceae bacterium]|nr:adenylate and Guanylate cyclase catalytic domain protein [Chthoniobacteraceae bacterium]
MEASSTPLMALMDCRLSDGDPPETLNELLDILIAHPHREKEITARIHERFEREKAVLILDISGFTRITAEKGIVAFLSMIRRMWRACLPCIRKENGELVKIEGDNLFCLFDSVDEAVNAASAILESLHEINAGIESRNHLLAAIGIGFGKILYIGNEDLFGCEVNLCSKLGEDLANPCEILFTESAQRQMSSAKIPLQIRTVTISGVNLTYYEYCFARQHAS